MQAFHQRGIHHYIADRPSLRINRTVSQTTNLPADGVGDPRVLSPPHPQGITYFLSKVIPPSVELPYFIKFLAWEPCMVASCIILTSLRQLLIFCVVR